MLGGRVDSGSGGFLSNVHNAYTSTGFARSYGSIGMVRAKAPTYRGQPGVEFGEEQLRYRSKEHTSELQSLMRISYAVFCLKKKKNQTRTHRHQHTTANL